ASFFEALGGYFPIEVLEESVEVFAAVDTVIDHVSVLVHIQSHHRNDSGGRPHIVHVEAESIETACARVISHNHPAAHALATSGQVIIEFADAAPTLIDSVTQIPTRLSAFST